MKVMFIFAIKVYQYCISGFLPPSCKYYPSCSEYAKEAIQRRGILIGTLLTVKRIVGCNPVSRGGYDPVLKEKRD